ncbi:MAG TPA: PaaX family transcriptional regulator C-terminal domain-containing protein [Euzebya sp.]|nr:PaaX family transcriptional regulator C-terminal domain-containing protein [Euzebya sp.]
MRPGGDRGELCDAYAAFSAAFGADLGPLDGAEAFVAQTRMVHEWRKFPFMDPGLPRQLLPRGWIGLHAAKVFADSHRSWAGPATAWFRAQNAPVRS